MKPIRVGPSSENSERSCRTSRLYCAARGCSQEEDVEVAPRQATRTAQDRGTAPEPVPGLPPAEAAPPGLPELQDVPRAGRRAAPYPRRLVSCPESRST